jgi:hypothetical protein
MLSFSSPRRREVSLEGGRNSVRLESSKSLEAFHRPRSPRSIVFRGLSSLGACGESQETAHAGALSQEGSECANATT